MPALIALVPAAGGGQRFGAPQPKQYLPLWQERTVLECTLWRLHQGLRADRIVVVLAADDVVFRTLTKLPPGVEALYCGGATRAKSVRNGLAALASSCGADDWVAVHDAARPCVPIACLDALSRWARDPVRMTDGECGALLAQPLTDTLKEARADETGTVRAQTTHDRSRFWTAQTPQMFRYGLLREALAQEGAHDCTDEAQAVEQQAIKPQGAHSRNVRPPVLLRGSAQNLKLTYAEDLALAQVVLGLQEKSQEPSSRKGATA